MCGGLVWGLVWFGLCWFCVFARSMLHLVFSFGILVWELHVVAPEWGWFEVGLVWFVAGFAWWF